MTGCIYELAHRATAAAVRMLQPLQRQRLELSVPPVLPSFTITCQHLILTTCLAPIPLITCQPLVLTTCMILILLITFQPLNLITCLARRPHSPVRCATSVHPPFTRILTVPRQRRVPVRRSLRDPGLAMVRDADSVPASSTRILATSLYLMMYIL